MVETMRTVKGYDGVITAIALVSVRPSAPPPFTPSQPRVATRLNTGPWLPWPLALLLSGSRNILEPFELHHRKRLKALTSAFTFKTLLAHYTNVTLGHQCKGPKA